MLTPWIFIAKIPEDTKIEIITAKTNGLGAVVTIVEVSNETNARRHLIDRLPQTHRLTNHVWNFD